MAVQRRGADRASAFGSAIKGWRFLLQSMILAVGALLAIRGEISPGVMIAASIVSARALAPVEQAIAQWRGLVAARTSWQSLRAALAAAPSPRAVTALPRPSHRLAVSGLAVAPPGLDAPVVRGVSFALEAGDAIGVIGPSGSGKSSLARALVGAWPTLRGSVRLDGADLDQWTRADRGRFIGYVPQDTQLIEGTVAQNIARFQKDAPAEAIVEAARLANADALITGLPEGFDTEVGPSGMALSAGQRQRIALARAFYGNPFLIVLDEPNANLDAIGEEALAAAVQTMRGRGAIVVLVAHRPGAWPWSTRSWWCATASRPGSDRRKTSCRRSSPAVPRRTLTRSSPVPEPEREALARSLKRHGWGTALLVLLLFAGCGSWAALAEIAGAVVAAGKIAVESSIKRVQHQDGGIVAERLTEAMALEARLTAERDGTNRIAPRPELRSLAGGARAGEVLAGQETLMAARRASLSARRDRLREQIVQYQRQIGGLAIQRDATAAEIVLIEDELADLEALLAKGLVGKSRVMLLRRDRTRLQGEHGGLVAKIAETEAAIGERRIELLQIDEERHAEIVAELQAARAEIAELAARRLAVEDRLQRVDLRAPRAGKVHNLAVHTIGGVIRAGEDLMEIVPRQDRLVVEARIRPIDIEQVWPGQSARVRLPAFDMRSTPELEARLETVTSEVIQEREGAEVYYRARLVIADAQLARLGDRVLVAGMPVEVFIATGMRSVLSYLLRPVTDQLSHALREG
jgi:HlyD family type I secretion membrane fusion protein